MNKGEVFRIYRFDNLFKSRMGKFTSFDERGTPSSVDLPGPPDYDVVCDGCGFAIKEDIVNALSFQKNFIHSIQCDKCIEEYFKDLPKREMLDPMSLLNRAVYNAEKMNVNNDDFKELQKEVINDINQFIEEIKNV